MDMMRLVAEAMVDGAFGLSTGLEYPPQTIVETDEIVELAKVAGRYGGIYSTHIRSRDIKVVAATKEAIEIGERACISVEGSHFGTRFPSDGKTKLIVELVEAARERGLDMAFDQVPWTTDEEGISWCGSTMVSPIVSGSKFTDKGKQISLDMLKDPKVVEFLKKDLPNRQYGPILAGTRGLLDTWDRFLLVHCEKNPQYNMRNLKEIGEMMDKDPFDALIEILIAEGENFDRVWGTVGFTSQWDTDFSLLHSFCSVTIDATNDAPYGSLSKEPVTEIISRAYGQFPYFIEKWVLEDRLLTLEDAIWKCTGLPAQRVRIMDRGLLRPGMYADIMIFDPKKIKNKSTWEKPRQYPEGISKVIVNGSIVVEDNSHSGSLKGKILRLNNN
jgi:N-acyl-D-amino-acid deacylase